jgi:hypothetical protein
MLQLTKSCARPFIKPVKQRRISLQMIGLFQVAGPFVNSVQQRRFFLQLTKSGARPFSKFVKQRRIMLQMSELCQVRSVFKACEATPNKFTNE